MRTLVAVTLAVAALAFPGLATAGRRIPDPLSVPVSNRGIHAHVCPIGPTSALTAEHVSSEHRPAWDRGRPWPLVFQGANGEPGTLMETWADVRRDLSRVDARSGRFPAWLARASAAEDSWPVPGDYVVLQGYDFAKGYLPHVLRAKVTNVSGGLIYFDGSPGPGSSGSCVVLERTHELVGINTSVYANGGVDLTTGRLIPPLVGIAAAVYGPWAPEATPEEWGESVRRPQE